MIKTANEFLNAVKERRSYYGISKEEVVSQARIEEIVTEAIKHTPTAFNSQSGRAVILFNDEHDKFWDMTEAELKKVMGDADFTATAAKMAGFRNGYGTVLFFEDTNVVTGLQEKFPEYADKFPEYASHGSGIMQFIVWTAIEQEGLGASLQHYQPIVDEQVQALWEVPAEWKLVAQMPFGKPTMEPSEKAFQAVDERLKVFK